MSLAQGADHGSGARREAKALRHAGGAWLVVGIGSFTALFALRELLGSTASGEYAGLPSATLIVGSAGASALLALGSGLRARSFGGLAPLGALVLAVLGALVGLADLSGLTPCPARRAVDLLACGLACAALLLVSPGMRQGRWRTVLRRRPASRVDTLFVAAALAIALAGASALGYQNARGGTDSRPIERPAILDLPAASVLFGAARPRAIAAYFLDLTSEPCREEFRELTGALGSQPLSAGVQLRFYHYPRGSEGCAVSGGERPQLRLEEGACLGAAAVECVELLAPGLGIRMAGELFDLQRAPDPSITTPVVAQAAYDVGLPIDVDDPQSSLLRCISNNPMIHRRVLAHVEFAERHGVDETPHGFFVGVREGRLDPTRVEAFRGDPSPTIRDRKLASAAGVETVEEFAALPPSERPTEPAGAGGSR